VIRTGVRARCAAVTSGEAESSRRASCPASAAVLVSCWVCYKKLRGVVSSVKELGETM
jgi:hypothetical protein